MRDILLLRIFSEADRAHFAPRKRLEELRFVLRCWQEQTCFNPWGLRDANKNQIFGGSGADYRATRVIAPAAIESDAVG
jgi:hypothetical protein